MLTNLALVARHKWLRRFCLNISTLALLLLGMSICDAQSSRPSYQLDASQSKVMQLTSLFGDQDCHPVRSKARVVGRKFDQNGIFVESLTVEGSDGLRSFVNVDVEYIRRFDRLTVGWIANGMQTLIREGHELDLGVKLCGAAGRFEWLDAIYSSMLPPAVASADRALPPGAATSNRTLPTGVATANPTAETTRSETIESPYPFPYFPFVIAGAVFLVGLLIARALRPESIGARVLIGILVSVASSTILYGFGIKDEFTLISVAFFGGIVVVAVSVLF